MDAEMKERVIEYCCAGKMPKWIAQELGLDHKEVKEVVRSHQSNSITERKRWLEVHGWDWQLA